MKNELRLEHVSKHFKSLQVLQDVSLTLQGGSVTGIIGPNGSGKSVLLKIIAGLIKPSSGKLFYNDEPLNREKSYTANIGICADQVQMIEEISGYDNLLFLANFKKKIGKEEIDHWLKVFGLWEAKDKRVQEYSMGMKQKLSIIQAVMEDQDIVLFDETSNSLDFESKQFLYQLIRQLKDQQKIVLYVNHNLDEVKNLCDMIYQIKDGGLSEWNGKE